MSRVQRISGCTTQLVPHFNQLDFLIQIGLEIPPTENQLQVLYLFLLKVPFASKSRNNTPFHFHQQRPSTGKLSMQLHSVFSCREFFRNLVSQLILPPTFGWTIKLPSKYILIQFIGKGKITLSYICTTSRAQCMTG